MGNGRKIGMFSYNSFLSDEVPGWKKGNNHEIFLVQNPDGKAFATTQIGISTSEMKEETAGVVLTGWQILSTELEKLDKLIIYVGSYGAGKAIQMARKNKIPDTKLTFVMCAIK